MIKSSSNKKIEFFYKKALAKNPEGLIIRPTQRRTVVKLYKTSASFFFAL